MALEREDRLESVEGVVGFDCLLSVNGFTEVFAAMLDHSRFNSLRFVFTFLFFEATFDPTISVEGGFWIVMLKIGLIMLIVTLFSPLFPFIAFGGP